MKLKKQFVYYALVALTLISSMFVSSCNVVLGTVGVQPGEANDEIFEGVRYIRQVRSSPRPMVIHVAIINLRQKGLSLLVTPGDAKADLPLKSRTTSQFLQEFDVQLAINGDGFTPWRSNGPFDYYPKAGDRVAPLGLAASEGTIYAKNDLNHPVLYFAKNNRARFNTPIAKTYNAISGNPMLVTQGKSLFASGKSEGKKADQGTIQDSSTPEPRTAIGLDKRGRQLILVVVDGRQPGYSEGVTLAELAEIMLDFDAYQAMNLDGGGSSTMVMQGNSGGAKVLNSPIDQQIPGRERYIGNHLGIFTAPLANR